MKKRIISIVLGMLVTLMLIPVAQAQYPVPREQAVVIETDTSYTVFDKANNFVPRGTQWGSGWHQMANEWDWYINYASGETIYWRTTGWEYSSDHREITWHIRKGVTWNDGMPYTAEDLVFTINLLLSDPALSGAQHVGDVESAKVVDQYTALIRFKAPQYRFEQRLRMWGGINIVAKHVWEGKDARDVSNWPPVETGPYKFYKVYPDLKMFVWERRDDYWAKEVFGLFPGPKYVIFRMAPPPDMAFADFVKGDVDAPLPHIFTWEMVKSAQRRTEYVVPVPFMDAVSQGLCSFNIDKYPTSLPEFRWALQYLLNREKAAKFYPTAEKTYPTMWPWPDWKALDKWEFPEISEKYGEKLRFDPAMAAQILDELGFKKGADGMRKTPQGEPLRLTALTRPAPDIGYPQAKDFVDELKKIGIDAAIKAVDAAMWHELVAIGKYDISFDVLSTAVAFPNDIYQFFEDSHSKHYKPIDEYMVSGDRGRSRLRSAELDAITDQMAAIDPASAEYMALAKKGLDIWYDLLPAVPMVEKTFVQTFSNRYWRGWPTEQNMYHVPYQWWPELIFVMFELKSTQMFTPES